MVKTRSPMRGLGGARNNACSLGRYAAVSRRTLMDDPATATLLEKRCLWRADWHRHRNLIK